MNQWKNFVRGCDTFPQIFYPLRTTKLRRSVKTDELFIDDKSLNQLKLNSLLQGILILPILKEFVGISLQKYFNHK